jgi:GntR family transcriptional repressor for pyruvate dehydrogenase complex
MGMARMSELGDRARQSRPTASDQLTRELLELIEGQELAPGDRLPTVTALAERFAVAPPTMREALRRLQAIGVVDIRHGSGVYVRRAKQRHIVSNPYSGQLNAETILDLLDARLLIEPHLACLAVARCDERAIKELEEILDRAEGVLQGPDTLLSGLNLDFHRAIARLSGNVVLSQTMDSILDLYAAEQMVILQLFDNRERDHLEHKTVLEAIRDRRPDFAGERMREHLEGVREVLESRLQPQKRPRARTKTRGGEGEPPA